MNDLPAAPSANAQLAHLERLLRSDLPVEKIEFMYRLYNAERDRQSRLEFSQAMRGLQGEVYQIYASGKNPTFRSAYATMHDLLKYTQAARDKYGITIRYVSALQKTEPVPPLRDGWQRMVAVIEHVGGHWEEIHLDGPPDIARNDRVPRSPVQSVGSTNMYLRRYLFLMALNLVAGGDPSDDDGEQSRGLAPLFPEQVKEIEQLLREAKMTVNEVSSLLKSFNATTIAEIRSRDYAQFCNVLIGRIKQNEDNNGQN